MTTSDKKSIEVKVAILVIISLVMLAGFVVVMAGPTIDSTCDVEPPEAEDLYGKKVAGTGTYVWVCGRRDRKMYCYRMVACPTSDDAVDDAGAPPPPRPQ